MCMAPRMRPATVKRMLAEEGFSELLELSRLDALGSSSSLGFYYFCRHAMETMAEHEVCPPRLIGGDDLIRLGFRPGPPFKQIPAQIDDLHLRGLLPTPA